MSLNITSSLVHNFPAAYQASFTTAQLSPVADTLYVLCIHSVFQGETESPSGGGLTWDIVGTKSFNASWTTGASMFRALSSSPGAPATISWTYAGGNAYCGWEVIEITGMDTSGTNGSGAFGTPGTANGVASITLTPFSDSNNIAIAGWTAYSVASPYYPTPGTGCSILAQDAYSGAAAGALTEYGTANDNIIDCSSSATNHLAGIAVEIKTGAGASLVVRRILAGGSIKMSNSWVIR